MARHAVFTIVQDDPINLAIWSSYYRRTYAAEDCYVLHHPLPGEAARPDWVGDIQGMGAGRGFALVPVFREESFDHAWLRETVQAFQRFLLQSYDTVLFAEVDEIVAVDPGSPIRGGLANYLDAFTAGAVSCVRCTGHEVVHDYAVEGPIDHGLRPLLGQRTRWYRARQYDKTLLSRVPLTWVDGFHRVDRATPYDMVARVRQAVEDRPDPHLLLLHLHKLDFATAVARHERSASRKWSAKDSEAGLGFQNRTADLAWLRDWWLNSVDSPGVRARWERMPEGIREIL
jgi:hypothetical protein